MHMSFSSPTLPSDKSESIQGHTDALTAVEVIAHLL